MNMNKTFFFKTEPKDTPRWRHIDAKGKVVGRLAVLIADMLRGKDKPTYTSHSDAGDYVVVTNVEQIVFTGDKWNQKEYASYSGYMGGLTILKAKQKLEKHPDEILYLAVKGMLSHSKLSRQLLRKLKIYKGAAHPHTAQLAGATPEKLSELTERYK